MITIRRVSKLCHSFEVAFVTKGKLEPVKRCQEGEKCMYAMYTGNILLIEKGPFFLVILHHLAQQVAGLLRQYLSCCAKGIQKT